MKQRFQIVWSLMVHDPKVNFATQPTTPEHCYCRSALHPQQLYQSTPRHFQPHSYRIPNTGTPVAVAGKCIIGSPQASTSGDVVGTASALGSVTGISRGSVIIGNSIGGTLGGGNDGLGRVVEGSLRLTARFRGGGLSEGSRTGGEVVGGTVVDGSVRVRAVVGGWVGVGEGGVIVRGMAEGRAGVGAVLGSRLVEDRLGGNADAFTLDEWLAGATMGVMLALETVGDGRGMGLAEIMGASKNGRILGICMAVGC